uniref:SRF n=1 Tax=Halisarca dujardinii TaxID=2583056 RepID=A0AAU8L0A7_HALDU
MTQPRPSTSNISTGLVSESITAGSNPPPLSFVNALPPSISFPTITAQHLNVARNMLGQTPQVIDPSLQFSSINSLVDQLNPPPAKQPRMEAPQIAQDADAYDTYDDDDDSKPGSKKTRGRVRIKMEYIQNKLRRYTTFSKRKSGIMKKAYELATLTGTQVMLLVASETGHVYTFATPKLQPMITSESGKALIQTCLNSPDPPFRQDQQGDNIRFSQQGFEETELSYPAMQDIISPKGMMQEVPVTTMSMPTHGAVLGPVVRVPFGMQLQSQHQLPISQGNNMLFGQQFIPSNSAPSHSTMVSSQPSSPPRHVGSPIMTAHSPPTMHRMSPSHTPYSQPSPMPSQPHMTVEDAGSPPSHMAGSPLRQGSPHHFPQEHLLPPLESYDAHHSPHGSPLRQQNYSPMTSSRNPSPVYSNHGSPSHIPMGHPMPRM